MQYLISSQLFRRTDTELTDFPQIEIPVLQFHGREDPAVSKDGLAGTWDWVDGEYTLVTYPGVGHIPQLQVPDRFNDTIKAWLTRSHIRRLEAPWSFDHRDPRNTSVHRSCHVSISSFAWKPTWPPPGDKITRMLGRLRASRTL